MTLIHSASNDALPSQTFQLTYQAIRNKMSASNRAALIGKLHTALKKHYKPLPAQPTRPLLEHLLYGSLLQDSSAELADEGMAKCEQEFFDWNEVRVTSITELTQVLSRLPDAAKAAARLKSNLQAIFEEFYTFDLDHLKKENLGKAVGKFEKMPGMTPFVLSYTVQHGLGGHSIPIDYSAMVIMLATEIASQPEAATGKVPGLERAIPKSKGIEFSGLLHQCSVALSKNLKDKTARAVLDAVDKDSSARLDEWLASKKAAKKRVVKRKTEEKAAAVEAAKAAENEPPVVPKKKAKKVDVAPKATPSAASQAEATKKSVAKKSASAAKTKDASSEVTAPPAADTDTPKSAKKSAKKSVKKPAADSKASKPPAKSASAPAKKATAKKKSTKKSASAAATDSKKSSSKKSDNRKLTKSKPR